jgi:hypothetical protein
MNNIAGSFLPSALVLVLRLRHAARDSLRELRQSPQPRVYSDLCFSFEYGRRPAAVESHDDKEEQTDSS